MRRIGLMLWVCLFAVMARAALPWQQYRGKAGPSGWRCHVIQPDPENHGPDGINLHDWDGDTNVVTTEENGAWGVIWFENPGN